MMGYIFRQVKALDDRMRAAAKLPCKTHPRFVKFEELMSENFVVRPTLGRPRKISSLKAERQQVKLNVSKLLNHVSMTLPSLIYDLE